MLDIKFIRQNIEKVKAGCRRKQAKCELDRLLELDQERLDLLQTIEKLKAEQNKISSQSSQDKKLRQKAKQLKAKIKTLEPKLAKTEQEFNQLIKQIPNLPLDSVPIGKDEKDNQVLKEKGQKPRFSFQPKDYLEIAERLDIIDVKRAAKTSGTRFGYLKGGAALLELGLIQLAFEVLVKEGFVPVIPPVMLKSKAMAAMGYLDKGADEVYYLEKDNLYLVGTAEQSIGAMHLDEVFQEQELPKRYIGFSTCFRREAGAYGKDTKGIFRVHQFDKVEMFSFVHPDKSNEEHQFLLSLEEKLMQLLKLPYRVVQLSTGDLSVPSAATYDIEVWLPGQNEYRETHSTSNCTDFQARRLNVRFRSEKDKKLAFVHTLNGTAFAIGRMIIAIIENYQQKDGHIKVPDVLVQYLHLKQI